MGLPPFRPRHYRAALGLSIHPGLLDLYFILLDKRLVGPGVPTSAGSGTQRLATLRFDKTI